MQEVYLCNFVMTDGKPPWSEERTKSDIRRYFDAGGNGVAMRILPHILFKADAEEYAPVAQNILLDGIVTHIFALYEVEQVDLTVYDQLLEYQEALTI